MMRIYRYWFEKQGEVLLPDGSSQPSRVFGYSNDSPEEARETAERNFTALRTRLGGKGGAWSYDARPIREEIVRELSPENIVTRNRYGADVLNSETLIFVDIDGFRPSSPSLLETLRVLFSGTMRRTAEERSLERIRKTASRPEYAQNPIRVYRTSAGFRLIVQGTGFVPGSKETRALMRAFDADRLYAALCDTQKCFRARLTPKPYRVRQHGRKFLWPRPEAEEKEAAEWLDSYRKKSESYAVCRYIETLNGSGECSDPIVQFHDEATRARSGNKLA